MTRDERVRDAASTRGVGQDSTHDSGRVTGGHRVAARAIAAYEDLSQTHFSDFRRDDDA